MKKIQRQRIDFLDTLRCIAALLVILQHIGEKYFSSFSYFTTHYFQFGMFGVTLFFLVSGFIIPVSLQKKTSLKKFWIKRFFRLYPLYIYSIILAIIFIGLGYYTQHHELLPVQDMLLQLTMLQKLLGIPLLVNSHWTLSLEMLFYISVTLLYMLNILRYSTTLAFVVLTLALSGGIILQNGYGLLLYFSMMFVGTVFYKFTSGQIKKLPTFLISIYAIFCITIISYVNMFGKNDLSEYGARNFVPATSAWILALLIFIVFLAFRNYNYPRFLLFLGKISFSLYLAQAVFISSVPYIFNEYFTVAITLFVISTSSVITYYYIEKPFVNIGNKIVNKKYIKKQLSKTI